MRLLLLLSLCLLSNACNNTGSYSNSRGYVISQSQETETVTEEQVD